MVALSNVLANSAKKPRLHQNTQTPKRCAPFVACDAIDEEAVDSQSQSICDNSLVHCFEFHRVLVHLPRLEMNVIQDKAFMQHFWDLAVDDANVRMAATAKVCASDVPQNYKSYTLKRLVKGLTSPRDSARLGFATALTQFITTNKIDPQEVLTLIDDHTKFTGALKGFEERDNMFGKLFGLASLIRSGVVRENDLVVLELIKRLIDLHQRKAWMQELAVENLLNLLFTCKKSIQLKMAPKLAEMCSSPLEEMSENELFLRIGLQLFASQSKDIHAAVYTTLNSENDFTIDKLLIVKPALFRSAHKFPKVHRLWDYILGLVFAWNEDRELVAKSSLSENEVTQVRTLVSFLNNEMFPFSKEKRALAMKLSLKMLYLVPVDCIPTVFTEKFVRSLYIARVNTKSTLFEFTGSILGELESFSGDSQERILALLTLIAEYGYINFDKATNVKMVQHLMAKMDSESMQQLMKILCANIGDSNDADTMDDSPQNEDSDTEENEEKLAKLSQNILRRNRGVAAIFLFNEMGKHVQPALRSQQTPIMMSILTRLACFSSGETLKFSFSAASITASGKKEKKTGKKDAKKPVSETTPEMMVMDDCIALLEANERIKQEGPSVEIQEQATLALLSLIHDTKSHLLFSPKQTSDNVDESQQGTQKKAAALAEIRIFTLWSKAFAHFVNSGLSNKHIDNDRLTQESLQELSKGVESVLQWLQHHLEDAVTDGEQHKTENFLMALLSVVIIASVHAVTSEEVDADVVTRTSDAALRLLLQLQNRKNSTSGNNTANKSRMDVDSDDEEDDEEDDPQLDLLDCSVEFLSVSADQAIKGLRDAIKRMWSAVFALLPEEMLSQTLIDVLVDVVMGNSRDEDAMGDEHDEEDDSDSEENEEDEEDEEEEEDTPVLTKEKKQQDKKNQKSNKKNDNNKKEEENDDDEDIVIKDGDFMDFMMVDDGAFCDHIIENKLVDEEEIDGDSDEEGGLVHSAEADDALGNLIRLRKESRKEGMMALHRKQILLRSRVLDILESFINRIRSGATLFSLLQPLTLGAKKAIKSKILGDINEGKTLLQRILSLLSQVSKKKVVIQVASQEGLEEEFIAELQEMTVILKAMITSKLLSIRQVAQDVVITLVRITWASDSKEAQTLMMTLVKELFQQFATKRHSTIPGKYLEDLLVQRFANVFIPEMLPDLIAALINAPVLYTKGEISDMLLSMLKRFANMDIVTKDAVSANIGAMVQAFATVFTSLSKLSSSSSSSAAAATTATPVASSSGKKDKEKSFSSKRAKPLLASLKSLVELLVRSNNKVNNNNNKQKNSSEHEKLFASLRVSQVQSLREGLQALSQSPAAAPLKKNIEEISALAQSLEETVRAIVPAVAAVPPKTPVAEGKSSKQVKSTTKANKIESKKVKEVVEEEDDGDVPIQEAVTKSANKDTSKKRKASDVEEEIVVETPAVAPNSTKKSKKNKSA